MKFNKSNVMRSFWFRLSIVFIFSSISLSVNSQNELSLGDALKLALANNYNIIIAEKNVEIAQNNYNKGEAGFYPSISFNVNNTNSLTDQQDPSSFLQGIYSSNRVTPNVDLKWVLFDGLRIRANYEQLMKLAELSEGNQIVVLQNTVQAVMLAYYNVLLKQEQLKTNRDVLALSSDRFSYFQNRKELGAAVTFDLVQAKNAMLNDSTIVVSQRLELQKSVRQLNRLMVVDLESEWQFTDSLIAVPALYNYETLKSLMLASNANLRVQFVNQELKNVAVKQSQAGQYPTIGFNPGINYTYNRFEGTLPSGDKRITNGTSLNYYANFTLNFNLYNGGKTRRAIKNARIDFEISQISTEDLELTLFQELGDQFNNWQAMIEILKIAEENLTSAELNMEIATEKYKNGNITSFNFRDVQRTYSVVALTKLQAEFNVIAAQTDLLRLTGGILSSTEE